MRCLYLVFLSVCKWSLNGVHNILEHVSLRSWQRMAAWMVLCSFLRRTGRSRQQSSPPPTSSSRLIPRRVHKNCIHSRPAPTKPLCRKVEGGGGSEWDAMEFQRLQRNFGIDFAPRLKLNFAVQFRFILTPFLILVLCVCDP